VCFGKKTPTTKTTIWEKTQEGTPQSRNLNDSAALAAKIAKKQAMKVEEEAKAAASAPVVRKKVAKKEDDTLDELLSAGLIKGKTKKR